MLNYNLYKKYAAKNKIKYDIDVSDKLNRCYYCKNESFFLSMINEDDGYTTSNIIPCCIKCAGMRVELGHYEYMNYILHMSDNIRLQLSRDKHFIASKTCNCSDNVDCPYRIRVNNDKCTPDDLYEFVIKRNNDIMCEVRNQLAQLNK